MTGSTDTTRQPVTSSCIDAQSLASRFEGAKRVAGGWIAKCSYHKDKSPSLKISDGRKATVLYCHAGCPSDEVLAAVGVRKDWLFHDFDPDRSGGSMSANLAYKRMLAEHEPPKLSDVDYLADIMWEAIAIPNMGNCNEATLSESLWGEASALAGVEWPWLMALEFDEAMGYAVLVRQGPLFTFLRPLWEHLGRPDWRELADMASDAMHRTYVERRPLRSKPVRRLR